MDLILDPVKEAERKAQLEKSMKAYDDKFGALDMEKSYKPLFELLWFSQMPCVDVNGITSTEKDETSFIKRCYWKNIPISCNAIFQKRPTDRGMCCSFNMEKADEILKRSKYTNAISREQQEEATHGFETSSKPDWYTEQNEPRPESGRNKGLTLIVDRHSDKISSSTVLEDFQGFLTVVEDNDKYPLTSSTSMIARPGHETNIEISAVQVESLNETRQFAPKKRNCYFPDEYELKMHKSYSQSNCLLECKVSYAFECMKTCMGFNETCSCKGIRVPKVTKIEANESCIPWFYPTQDKDAVKMCNPWNTLKFRKIVSENIPRDQCNYCLPECTTTVYSTASSYAALQKCDHTNTGTNRLCNMMKGTLNPAPWTYLAQQEYEKASPNESLPWYLQTDLAELDEMNSTFAKFPDQRRKISDPKIEQSALFTSELKKNPTYNAFEKDIGFVNIFFGKEYSTRYIKKNRLSGFDILSQVGGSIGLAMGVSLISVVEFIYWFAYRIFGD